MIYLAQKHAQNEPISYFIRLMPQAALKQA